MGTWWDNPIDRRLYYLNQSGLDEILLGLHHVDVDRFTRKRPFHERHATVTHARECIAARHQALDLHSFHSREL
jgi:hypothetical protein